MSKVSIALCTYNGAKFLPEQLASFLTQTRLPDEIIVCDDCSTDTTAEIVRNFARQAPFPVALHVNATNLGSTKNFEKAIRLCTGDFIFLSDQDDVWFASKIKKFLAEFEKSKSVGMVFSDAELVGETLERLGHKLWDFSFLPEERRLAKSGKMFEVLLRRNVVTGAATAFRAEFRELFMPIPTNVPNVIHDAWIALVIAANADVRFIEEPTIFYRQHSDQQLGIDWRYREKLNRTSRRKKYEQSIYFQRKEQERFDDFTKNANFYPPLQKRNSAIPIDELIKLLKREGEQKIEHYEARKNLPTEKIRRVFPIIKEISTGRYRRFSKTFVSPLKDLLETW